MPPEVLGLVAVAVIALLSGVVGALIVDGRFWLRFVREIYRHGLDNHFCGVVGCCR